MTVLVATEAHFVRGPDGRVYSESGIDGYKFWTRYLDVFDRVLVAARTGSANRVKNLVPVEGPGVEVAPLPEYRGPWGYLRVRRNLLTAMNDAIARVEVLCLRAPGPIAGCAWALRSGRPVGVEVVGDPRDALSRGAVRSVVRPFARVALTRDLRAMCRGALGVAYVTESFLQERYGTGGWSVACSDADLDDGAYVSERRIKNRFSLASCATKGSQANPWRVIFVGSLAQLYKGQDVLVEAVALCREQGPELELNIVGEGGYRSFLETRARELGLGTAVSFAGLLSAGSAVQRALDRADLFVLPSRTEGLPRAMIEAMARGLPCLGSRLGGIPELLPESELVVPADPRALADAITRLLSKPAELLRIALRNRSRAAAYHRDVLRRRRNEFYQRLRAASRDWSCGSAQRRRGAYADFHQSKPCEDGGRRPSDGP